jgi:hypothetical protein
VAETYSLASVAAHAASKQTTKIITLPDSVAQPGSIAKAMQTGSQILCKNPDGSLENYTIDHERSRPGGPIYLLRTRP